MSPGVFVSNQYIGRDAVLYPLDLFVIFFLVLRFSLG